MRRIVLALILILCLVSSDMNTMATTGGDCSTWTRGYKPYSAQGNMLGCRYNGYSWHGVTGTCNTYARAEARKGYRGIQVFYRITSRGCAMDDRGMYYSVTVR